MRKLLFIIPRYNVLKNVSSFRNTYWVQSFSKKSQINVFAYEEIGDFDSINASSSLWKMFMSLFKSEVIIISGPPFKYFSLIFVIKVFFPLKKVILDYRDPFAINPRFSLNRLQTLYRSIIEFYINSFATEIIVVTEEAKDYTVCFNKKNIKVIDNGFDDLITENVVSRKFCLPVTYGYAGKVYPHNNTDVFLDLEHGKDKLIYIGNSNLQSKSIYLKSLGTIAYSEVIKELSCVDICLLWSNINTYQTYTKLYDYIGLKRIILLIWDNYSDDNSLSKSMLSIKNDYPLMYATSNEETTIASCIEVIKADIQSGKLDQISKNLDVSKFSRKEGAKKLQKIIENL